MSSLALLNFSNSLKDKKANFGRMSTSMIDLLMLSLVLTRSVKYIGDAKQKSILEINGGNLPVSRSVYHEL